MVLVLVIKSVMVVFFAVDDIILIAPSERKMKALYFVMFFFCWANKNEMSFGINKCATMVIKPLNFCFISLVMKNLHFTLVCILSL